jgi:Bacterial lectin
MGISPSGGLRERTIMRLTGSRHSLVVTVLFALAALSQTASAQQITYYDFNGPQGNPSQVSRQCTTPALSGVLFCFNDGTGQASSPSFLSDTYPASIDPVLSDNPPVQSTNTAIQLTFPQLAQAASMWFSVPQKVSSGFTSWFAFKITPNANSYATADGIAFVIQNSAGGASTPICSSIGSGLSIVGGGGGCIGYGGIDNSLAIELDTYRNPWDPDDNDGSYNDNHVAVQNCGPGLANSPDHTGSCLVSLNVNNTLQPAINSKPGVTLADGNVHQVVVSYSGPNEAVPYLLQIYIDPPFVPDTHTPAAGAVPVLSGTYNLAANLNLMNSGSSNDSAYVGFTSATGGAFEQHELLAWTYTPHATVVQQQPLSPPGQPTVFPFGSHVYVVTYPASGPSTSGIDMVVAASPIAPLLFSQLVSSGPFAGSQCQVYDETGGNCIVYSVSCVDSATNAVTQCPATDTQDPILVKSALNNSIVPVSPGFLRGDPFYTLISSIIGNGQTATVTCAGECSVTAGQTVTVAGTQPSGFNGTVTVLAADPSVPNVFTFASKASGTATGGYLTSNNLQNIFLSYSPLRIDESVTGITDNFSDFVVTSVTTSSIATVSPTSLNFGTLYLGDIRVLPVTLTNTGNTSMTVDEPLISDVGNGNSNEFIALSLCPRTLAVGKSCSIFVTFLAGPNYGLQTAILKIMDSAPGAPQSVNLSATVIPWKP